MFKALCDAKSIDKANNFDDFLLAESILYVNFMSIIF